MAHIELSYILYKLNPVPSICIQQVVFLVTLWYSRLPRCSRGCSRRANVLTRNGAVIVYVIVYVLSFE